MQWTPVAVVADSQGKERYRFEGFLPVDEFLPQAQFGLAKAAFESGDFARAEEQFRSVANEHGSADIAPEAIYWAGVAKYKGSGDAGALAEAAATLESRYSSSVWAKKSSIWRSA